MTRNEYAVLIARLAPLKPLYPGHAAEGWETRDGSLTVSSEGRAHLADMAVIFDAHSENMAAFMEAFGQTRCRHNRPLDDLSWSINDYVTSEDGCSGLRPWFMLWGAHHDLDPIVHQDGWAFCAPYEYHNNMFMRT